MKVNQKLILSSILFVIVVSVKARNVPSVEQEAKRRPFGPSIRNDFTIFSSSERSNNDLTLKGNDKVEAAIAFFAGEVKVRKESVKISSFHTSKHNGVTHIYVQQLLNGTPVANGFGNINVLKNGQVHSVGESFYSGPLVPIPSISMKPKYSATDAVKAFAKFLKIRDDLELLDIPLKRDSLLEETVVTGARFAVGDVSTELNYLQTENGIRLVRKISVDMIDNFYVACLDTDSNQVLSLVDYVSDVSYNVVPFGINDPNVEEQRIVPNPEDRVSSPMGWHQAGDFESFSDTIGNNVIAQENLDAGFEYHRNDRPIGTTGDNGLVFDFKFDKTQHPSASIPASVTQLFYMNNIIHDVFYRYGFTEEAGNFQENNLGLGGFGSDSVIADTQDGSGTNNANFRTPPDGSNGRMRMYIFNEKPADQPELVDRDSSFDSGIVIHEYLHGISTRLTGGRLNSGCLQGGESGGMGEGWGDIYAIIFMCHNETRRDQIFYIGSYSLGTSTDGFRKFPYSTDLRVNPSTYSYTALPDYSGVHAKGEVWAVILYEVFWNLVEKHGFQDDWYETDPANVPGGKLGGNVIFAQLLIDGMKFQPCYPNFIQARDAIIVADLIYNDGENYNELWKGFSKRGLGYRATFPAIQNFDMPPQAA